MSAATPDAPDLAIIGSGPAGLAAAIAARALGLSVLVIEREAEPGGIPRHCAHSPYGWREYRRLMTGPAFARRLADDAARAGAVIACGTTVMALNPGPALTLASDRGIETITPARVLLAMGARETPRSTRLIGGTKPGGVLNTGALQGLVHLNGMLPFRRPVVLGTELVAFSALLTLRLAGANAAAMVEPADAPTARWPAALLPRLLRVPLHLGTRIDAIEGTSRVEGVRVTGPRGTRRIAADGVVVTGGFRPEAALLRGTTIALDPATGGPVVDQFGRTSDPAVFAAGNLLRPVETAGWCHREGRAAAATIAASLAGELPPHGPALSITLGDGVAYVVPQRIALGTGPHHARGPGAGSAPDAAQVRLQLRLTAPVRGEVRVEVDGRRIASLPVDSRPERRLVLTLPPDVPPGSATVRVEAEA
ncbi:FAD-dependent oxidoreductase [Acuticoccus yangtzensis]|uniref:FAD-dependent oxidoreductase n=1 Tax=Acuticoccus yangtzensis TaxID=1443441 RepID=UPI0009498677|nr:FAD-dependent oxidoreductase [Acuticoccus yangtzensis]